MTVENRLLDKADWYFEKAVSNYLHSYQLQKEALTQNDVREIYRWAANHIGFFLTWIIQQDAKETLSPDEKTACQSVKNEQTLGVDCLLDWCDGKLGTMDIKEEFQVFVNDYYEHQYMDAYSEFVINDLDDLPLEFLGSWEDYHLFAPIIDDAYADYLAGIRFH